MAVDTEHLTVYSGVDIRECKEWRRVRYVAIPVPRAGVQNYGHLSGMDSLEVVVAKATAMMKRMKKLTV